MFNITATGNLRKQFSKEWASSIILGQVSKYAFSDDVPFTWAEASKTGITLVVALFSLNTGL